MPGRSRGCCDEREFELLLRNCDADDHRAPWNPVWMPNRKTDANDKAVSTNHINANHAYPEATHEERQRIVAGHRRYLQGLMWMVANHGRVPEPEQSTEPCSTAVLGIPLKVRL